jgi:hypothetical protein
MDLDKRSLLAQAMLALGVCAALGSLPYARAGSANCRYVKMGDFVLDQKTNLLWEDNLSRPQLAEVVSVTACPMGFRIPSVLELATLVDEKESSPAIDHEAFPKSATASRVWTYAPLGSVGPFYIDFADGSVTAATPAGDQAQVRCVKTHQR